MLGDKSPPTPSSGLGTKIPDDTQLFINSVLLHNPTNQSSDQKGLEVAQVQEQGGEEDSRKRSKGRYRKVTVTAGHHSHCSETIAFISAHQQTQTHLDLLKTLL